MLQSGSASDFENRRSTWALRLLPACAHCAARQGCEYLRPPEVPITLMTFLREEVKSWLSISAA